MAAWKITSGHLMSIGFDMQAQFLSNDPSYLTCKKHECQTYSGNECAVRTCSGSITFHVVNFRTDVAFVFFTGGFDTPCVLRRSDPIGFSNPNSPLYGHLSSIDSTGTSVLKISFQCSKLHGSTCLWDHNLVMIASFFSDEGDMGQWRQ